MQGSGSADRSPVMLSHAMIVGMAAPMVYRRDRATHIGHAVSGVGRMSKRSAPRSPKAFGRVFSALRQPCVAGFMSRSGARTS